MDAKRVTSSSLPFFFQMLCLANFPCDVHNIMFHGYQVVSTAQGQKLADEYGIKFFETVRFVNMR
jgi:hypothetical protein